MDNKKNGIPKLRFPGFTGAWEQRKLGEITKTHSLKQYISEAFDHGKYMVIQQGENPIAGYANGDPFENFKDVTLFGDHTLSLFKPQEKFFVASDGIKILSPSLKMNGMFYYYLLEKYRPQSEGYKRHFTIMKKSTALFPIEIDEQIKISNFLKELDSLIALHQRKLEHLQEQKKGLLQKMFPKNGETVPEVRFPGFTDAWEQRKFSEILAKSDGLRRGPFGSALKKEFFISSSEYTVYEQNNAIYNTWKTRYFITPEKFQELHKFQLVPGDFILSGADTIGRIAQVPANITKGVFNQALIRIRINPEWMDKNFFLIWMQSENMQRKLTQANPGSAMTNLVPMSEIKKWEIIIPSKAEQNKIGEFIQKLNSLITLHQRKLDHLELMKKGLLQQMFV